MFPLPLSLKIAVDRIDSFSAFVTTNNLRTAHYYRQLFREPEGCVWHSSIKSWEVLDFGGNNLKQLNEPNQLPEQRRYKEPPSGEAQCQRRSVSLVELKAENWKRQTILVTKKENYFSSSVLLTPKDQPLVEQ